MARRILVVDDEKLVRWSLSEALKEEGYDVLLAETGEEALELARRECPDVILLDIALPGIDGVEVLRQLQEESHPASIIMISAGADIQTAVKTIQMGAVDFATKPLNIDDIRLRIQRAVATDQLRTQVEHLRKSQQENIPRIVGKSEAIKKIVAQAEKISRAMVPTVLITGESGTGKDLLARTIHAFGPRSESPMMEIHCSAIPETLLESELFGYEKGAFTDARSRKKGLLEAANHGVVFLNEIGDLSLSIQTKLLDVLENHRFRRLGSTTTIQVDTQIIAATNRNLEDLIREGTFRQDLFYRLNVVRFEIPPLRARQEDIPLLIDHFLGILNRQFRKQFTGCEEKCLEFLMKYPWPGNVRELHNILERIVLMESGPLIEVNHLPCEILEYPQSRVCALAAECGTSCLKVCMEGDFSLERAEKTLIRAALQTTNGNQTRAAELLGISRDTLRYRLQKYGLNASGNPTGPDAAASYETAGALPSDPKNRPS